MTLCFGTFASILNLCQYKKQGQATLVARLAYCVDRASPYFKSGSLNKTICDVEGLPIPINRVLRYKRNFVLSYKSRDKWPTIDNVIEHVQEGISPLIDEGKKAVAIFAILEVVRRDSSLCEEKAAFFEKCLNVSQLNLIKQKKFSFPDFIGRILYFTVFGDVNNIFEKDSIEPITEKYIKTISDHYFNEYTWKPNEEMLELSSVPDTIFNLFFDFLNKYEIIEFIEKIHPVPTIKFAWIEKCQDFIDDCNEKIYGKYVTFQPITQIYTLRLVERFCQILDEYITYFGKHMIPLADNPEIFVPNFPKDPVLDLKFSERAYGFRKQLCDVFMELQEHVIMVPLFSSQQS